MQVARGPAASVTVVEIGPGGRLGRHPAGAGQLLVVIAGEAEVSGADGVAVRIGSGSAVFWEAGEEHETATEHGVTALVVEAAGLAHP